MRRTRVITLVAVVVSVIIGSIAAVPAGAGPRKTQPPMEVTLLADGLQGSVGATIGPDGALYVAEGALGRITRIDPSNGSATTFASGLPPQVIPLGGAIDVAFVGSTLYVLVTVVGPDVGGNSVVGIYRKDGSGDFSVFADLGAWSIDNPPATAFDHRTASNSRSSPSPTGSSSPTDTTIAYSTSHPRGRSPSGSSSRTSSPPGWR